MMAWCGDMMLSYSWLWMALSGGFTCAATQSTVSLSWSNEAALMLKSVREML
jgi:hypothetical protein